MRNHTALLAAIATGIATLHAAPVAFDFKDPKGVNNVTFTLDAPLESISGYANGVSGIVTLDPATPHEAVGKIVVDAKSLTVPNPVMQEHMHGADWLDIAAHPEITFEIKSINVLENNGSDGNAEVTGDFTLKGVTKEITAPAKVTHLPGRLADRSNGQMQGDLLVIRSDFTIKRGNFGIKAGENLDKVSDDIEVSLSIAGAAPKE
jgi:polyisoprenoid-binding protein YceI